MLRYVNMTKSRYINLYLPEELVKEIDAIASKEDRSRNYVVRKILEKRIIDKK